MTSGEKAEKLILAHDGDMALLYIYFTRKKTTDVEQAARDLFMTLSRAEAAYEKLEIQGFFDDKAKTVPVNPLLSDEEPREYRSDEIEEASKDIAYKALLDEGAKITGRILTKDDMSRLLDIYKHLGMPADTIFVLMHYCENVSTRKPRMSYIQKVAYTWYGNGIISVDQAEEFFEKDLARRSDLGKIKSALHIYDRDFTTREREMANSWIDMGFTEDDVGDAYEICVDNNGKYVSAYINKILVNWNEKGREKPSKKEKAPAKPVKSSTLPESIRKKNK